MKTTLITFCFLLFLGLNTVTALHADPPTAVKVVEKDFPIFKDVDYKVMYLDFELLTSNVKSIKIIKDSKDIAYQADLKEVAVDAIYEINYSDYTAGEYHLELETYSGKVLNSDFILE